MSRLQNLPRMSYKTFVLFFVTILALWRKRGKTYGRWFISVVIDRRLRFELVDGRTVLSAWKKDDELDFPAYALMLSIS